MKVFTRGMVGILVLAGSSLGLQAASVFNFNNDALGTATTFTDSDAVTGLSATFSSQTTSGVDAPGTFTVSTDPSGIGVPTNGTNYHLIQTNESAINNGQILDLKISFNSLLQTVQLPFAVLAPQNDPAAYLTLTAFLNGTQVGSTVTSNTTGPGTEAFYSIGSIAFDAGANANFDSLILSSGVPGFGIDDVSVATPADVSGVPEPGSTALMVLGFAGLLAFIRKQKQRRMAPVAVK